MRWHVDMVVVKGIEKVPDSHRVDRSTWSINRTLNYSSSGLHTELR
jgi:hypothetical protein